VLFLRLERRRIELNHSACVLGLATFFLGHRRQPFLLAVTGGREARTVFGDLQPARLLLEKPDRPHKLSVDAQLPLLTWRLDRVGEDTGRNGGEWIPAPLWANMLARALPANASAAPQRESYSAPLLDPVSEATAANARQRTRQGFTRTDCSR
jgi:hypothetical protein